MPSYPHWKPGDPKPTDKLLILEDTDHDGKADKQTIFADNLHLPMGFELAAEGVYVSQGTNMVLLSDTNGDDKADKREILRSEEHTSELQSLMRISYAVFCLKQLITHQHNLILNFYIKGHHN